MLLGHESNKTFLVPDSCRATERNGNSIFSENFTGVLDFLIVQDDQNIRNLSLKIKINLQALRNRLEKLTNDSLFYLFLKLVQINFIFAENVRILYTSLNKNTAWLLKISLVSIKLGHFIIWFAHFIFEICSDSV